MRNKSEALPASLIPPASFEESSEIRAAVSLPCSACGAPRLNESRFCTACGVPHEVSVPISNVSPTAVTREGGAQLGAGPLPQSNLQVLDHIHCANCGADIDVPSDLNSIRCPFCDSTYVVKQSNEDRTRQRPEFIIGFAVSKQKATELFFEWIGRKGWFQPGDLKYKAVSDKQEGVYIPFWHFTLKSHSKWSARIGEYWYRTETYTVTVNGKRETRTRTVQETEWWPLSGVFRKYYSGYMVSASKGLPQDEAVAIQPYRLSSMMRFRPHFLAGWMLEEYSISRQDAMGLAKSEFLRREKEAIAQFLPGDTHSSLNVFTSFEEGDTDLVLLPVHIMAYHYRGKVYRFLVNGQTGKVYGEKPWSALRIAAAVIIGIILIAILVIIGVLIANGRGGV
jgi:DNA-directed RNA polymerase subunit RPC12/RpoP